MNKKEKVTLVPNLRFPEFCDSDEWYGKKLGQLLTFGNGRDYKQLLEGCIPVYGSGGYMLSVNDYLYDGESVCIGRKGTINNPILLSGKFWTVDTLFYTHSYVNCIPRFVYYLFQQIDWLKYNEAGGVPSLSKTTIEKIKVFIPKDIEEQQKIADCLSSIDDFIVSEDKKIEILKNHKKGLLQKLFPKAGKTTPEFRFPEFSDTDKWEETTLDEVADYENGKAHENEISEKGKYIVVNSKFISTEGKVKKYSDSGNLLACAGDILMVLSDVPNGRAIAKCYYVEKDQEYTVNQRICRLIPRNIDGQFLFYIVNRNNYFLNFDDGVKQTNLKKDDVLMFPFFMPKDPKEQRKIAYCLSTLDDLINALSEKNEALKDHKKGLMQRLFHSADKVGQ